MIDRAESEVYVSQKIGEIYEVAIDAFGFYCAFWLCNW
jgi:hypothetical protein